MKTKQKIAKEVEQVSNIIKQAYIDVYNTVNTINKNKPDEQFISALDRDIIMSIDMFICYHKETLTNITNLYKQNNQTYTKQYRQDEPEVA